MGGTIRKNTKRWRLIHREGDGLIVKLTRTCQRGDRVYFDPGPGLRISGVLKDWDSDGVAAVEVDAPDVGIPEYERFGLITPETQRIMRVPVR